MSPLWNGCDTVYVKTHYLKEISNNPFARARFDSAIIDAKHQCESFVSIRQY